MYKNPIFLLSVLLAFSLGGCVSPTQAEYELAADIQDTSKPKRLTQFQLDAAFRSQSMINEATADRSDDYEVCCVLFYEEYEALEKVFTHFKNKIDSDLKEYGTLIQFNEKIFIVHLGERYKVENQFYARGNWWPDNSQPPIPSYRYTVDRETLEILEFQEFPQ